MQQYWQEKYVRYLGIFILSIIMNMIYHSQDGFTLINMTISLTITFLMWEGNRTVLFWFRKRYPNINDTNKRLILTIIGVIAYTLLMDFIVESTIKAYFEVSSNVQDAGKFFRKFIATGVVVILYESAYFFSRWKETIVEKESLRHQQVRSQFAALKNQISPHFLFNSLNTLVTLIAENQEVAIDFTQKLSEAYRYILQNREKEVITLARELEFAQSYIFLLKMRFAENFHVQIDIEKAALQRYIAPLCLQMLIENAIKHNEVSTANPLHLHISVENGNTLTVKNNLQRKRTVEHSTKMGLENIKKRYHHLSDRQVEVITTVESFIVTLPLLKISRTTSIPVPS